MRAAESDGQKTLSRSDTVTMTLKTVDVFLARKAARMLPPLGHDVAGALVAELHALPTLEDANRLQPIPELPAGYRSLILPSGYVAVYRRLTPVEIKQVTGDYSAADAYLVADLVPLNLATDGSST